jgi:3-oxoacyl-[acyl-carrier protein] reductase
MPNVLITGAEASKGIGAACARKLGGLGWSVGLSRHWQPGGRDQDDVVGELRALGVHAEAAEADLSEPGCAQRLFDELEQRLGAAFTALVACHCRDVELPLMGTPAEEFDRHFAVNARSVAMLIQEFARRLPGDDGRVVAFTSDALEDNVPYGISKAALDRVVKAAAVELGPRGIRANAVNPGPTETGWITEPLRADLSARTPLGRPSLPVDGAELVAFLLSSEGGWITGQLLHSNGGLQ